MERRMFYRNVLVLSTAALGFMSTAGYAGGRVETLCHFPPGNPENMKTLTVGAAAVSAHLEHGDELGACSPGCPDGCDDENACTIDSCGSAGECEFTSASKVEQIETSCADGFDNDGDGAVDDADTDCPFITLGRTLCVCSDGALQPGEECDDGNENPFDGCDHCIIVDITPD